MPSILLLAFLGTASHAIADAGVFTPYFHFEL